MVLHKQPPARVGADAEVERGRAERVLVCTREHEPVSRGPQQARGVGEVVVPGGLQDVKLTGVRNGDGKLDDPVVMNAQVSDDELVAGQRDGVADGVRGPLPIDAGGGDREGVPAGLGGVDRGAADDRTGARLDPGAAGAVATVVVSGDDLPARVGRVSAGDGSAI